MSLIVKVLLILSALYLLFLAGCAGFQRKLMYFPSRDIVPVIKYGLDDFYEKKLTTKDNIELTLWHRNADKNKPTIIFFLGNAGNVGVWNQRYKYFANQGYGIIALNYRGYGNSQDVQPTEQGLYLDAEATIGFARNNDIKKIILYGVSLGTGVTVEMASRHKDIRAIILESPYSSTVDVAQKMFPILPAKWLMKDQYLSIEKIGNITTPLLIYHGEKDNLIPHRFGKKLFDAANDPKTFVSIPNIGHNIIVANEPIGAKIIEFIEGVL